jgi:hypothetical protein
MRRHKDFNSPSHIWELLRLCWRDDRVKAWHDKIFSKGAFTEVCYNLISVNPLAHRYHGNGYFALKPIELSTDRKCLKVRFFWLQQPMSLPSYVNILGAPLLEGKDKGLNKAIQSRDGREDLLWR